MLVKIQLHPPKTFLLNLSTSFMFIYGLLDPRTNELRYIGYTCDLKRRLNDHHKPSRIKSKTHKNNWLNSLLLDGLKAELIVLESYSSIEDLLQAEIELIEYYRYIGANLTNGTTGGDGLSKGFKHTKETKLKIAAGHLGKTGANKNRKWSDEYKKKISESLRGRQAWNKGKNHSIETKKKISETQKTRRDER